MISLTSKLPNSGTTIFTVMSALAAKHNAVNLGQGFPDFAMDAELISMVNEAMTKGANQYVHMSGLPYLRQGIAEKVKDLYNNAVDADTNITVTPGATYAIYTALTAVLQPGDEVIYFEPAYDSYLPNILINGGVPVPIKLQHPEYSINWNLVKDKLNAKTRAIIINTPHNPTGSLMSDGDMRTLEEMLSNTNVLVISDEVYEHLVFDGMKHRSVLSYPGLFERSIATYSFGKVYHCTGWKMGYAIA
ncbi:MAG: aminotransferase class I/II-fold pyridoxal phosphate-dependent enzyme, partial [Chitinophagaceae bacterium]